MLWVSRSALSLLACSWTLQLMWGVQTLGALWGPGIGLFGARAHVAHACAAILILICVRRDTMKVIMKVPLFTAYVSDGASPFLEGSDPEISQLAGC